MVIRALLSYNFSGRQHAAFLCNGPTWNQLFSGTTIFWSFCIYSLKGETSDLLPNLWSHVPMHSWSLDFPLRPQLCFNSLWADINGDEITDNYEICDRYLHQMEVMGLALCNRPPPSQYQSKEHLLDSERMYELAIPLQMSALTCCSEGC